jgi:hypothetical protein
MPAFFSKTDDASDVAGVYLASVLGQCHTAGATTSCSRLVLEGRTFPVARTPWVTREEHENRRNRENEVGPRPSPSESRNNP